MAKVNLAEIILLKKTPINKIAPAKTQVLFVGGTTQTRTGGKAFAELCLTTWLWCHVLIYCSK